MTDLGGSGACLPVILVSVGHRNKLLFEAGKLLYGHKLHDIDRPKRLRRTIIIDDDPAFISALTCMLESLGFEVKFSTDARLSQTYEIRDSDIVFVDALMPNVSGLQVLEQLSRQGTKALIVVMSADPQSLDHAENLARKLELDIVGVLEKPFRFADLKFILDDL